VTATRVDLVRHGHVQNPERKVYGRLPGWKLSAEGRRQAAEVAGHLRGRPIVHVYASPLERATETAAAIAKACGVSVSTDPALIESDLGAHWEGLRWSEVRTTRHAELDAYLHRPHEVDFVAETFHDLGDRMASAVRAIAARHVGEEAVIVSHGDPIKAAICRLTGTNIADMHSFKVPTGSLVAVAVDGDAVRVVERWEPPRTAKI
jgi:broad specificity phosphatase PhoE